MPIFLRLQWNFLDGGFY